jgi:DNA-directed RNA polymerase specialized sigma24 family protein
MSLSLAVSPPPPEEGLRLHARLCAGDPTASADFAAAYLPWLEAWLGRRFPRVAPDLRADAAEDALVSLIKRPGAYVPGRGDLAAYLTMAARADLANLLRKERRHRRALLPLQDVELSPAAGKYLVGADPAAARDAAEGEAERADFFAGVAAGLSPGERLALELLRRGERSTDVFAEALGLAGLPGPERAAEVKRVKDRVKKRLRRAGGAR